ncbi:sugar ABC transporter substrate-binding protein [Microbacterium sp. NPDC076911]|uniref:ABC transporter substrate-binding protein n=1 Tax=Microbacterium sp. NPDC076911 TaxID=3154958 RepID=UPI003421CDB1
MRAHPTRVLAGLAGIGMLATAVTACSSGSADTPDTTEITAADTGAELNLWVRPGNEAVTDEVVAAYNETHDNQVTITHVPADQYMTKFAQSAQTDSLPDLLATDLVFMPQVIDTGALLDLTELLEQSGAAGNLTPAHIQASTHDGSVYGVPYVADTSLYLYNKDLFEEAGLDPEAPPTTWEGIAEAALAVSELGDDYQGFYVSGGCSGCLSYTLSPLFWAQGAEVVDADGKFHYDTTDVQDSLAFLQGLSEAGTISPSSKTDTGEGFFAVFAAGKTGINFAGGNGVNTSTIGSDPEFDFGLAPIPGPVEGEWATFSGGDALSIAGASQNLNEAWDFVNWLTSLSTSEDVYFSLPAIPPRTDTQAPESLGEQFTIPAELVKSGQTYVSPWYNDVVASAQGPWLEMVQDAMFNGVDPVEATRTAQLRADEITQ